MKHTRSIRMALIILVLLIMVISDVITFTCLTYLQEAKIIDHFSDAPTFFLLLGLFVAIVLGTILTIPVSKHFLKPINHIIQATKKVGAGDFDVQVPEIKHIPNKTTEIAELTDNFNTMIKELGSIELLKKDFINNFSHEFKTPIASIIGFAKELQHDDLNEEEKALYLSLIIKEAERLSALSSTILALSKFENQNIVTNKTNFRLDEQIRECIVVLQDKWEKKNIEFSLELDKVTYLGNKEMLNQVWLNLLENAIKFSFDNGLIEIELTQINQEIKIIFKDHGIGIKEEDLAHVFEKFYQADKAHTTIGNGLGLPLVKKIIKLCQGNIDIQSTYNVGTLITITLPSA